MVVLYDSLTGQGKKLAEKLGYPYYDIKDYNEYNDDIFLITRSFNFGQITKEAMTLLGNYSDKVIGVAVSGNRNWGTNYGAAGDKINQLFGIELVLKFEGSGFPKDVDFIKQWLQEYEERDKR